MRPPKQILPTIIVSQFFCTSLWFAGNGVIDDLIQTFGLAESALGHLTSVVQFGFILGTLVFAILSIADRYSPSRVFFVCALLAATCNLGMIWEANTLTSILTIRFFTGFFLAGIYPVGMKIAAGFFEKGLGKSLGFLVGALVVGTALPHLLKEATATFSWTYVLLITSTLAALGGVLMVALVPDGPFRKPSQQLQLSAFYSIFKKRSFRSAAFGYFGHMWELYAFWAFVPVMLQSYARTHPEVSFNVPLLSFLIIGIGGLSCVLAGYLAQAYGAKRVASSALCLSGLCCLLSPVLFASSSAMLFVSFLLFWGMVVIADSPLFSTLVAQHAPPALKGTALTIVNCVGFAITILSIQLLTQLSTVSDTLLLYVVLAIGLVLGLVALWGRELFAGK